VASRCADDAFFGCRFSLYPMTDRFVDVILDSLAAVRVPGIEVETDDVSTCLIGPESAVFAALRDCLARASSGGTHVVMTATFSKGCPGEPSAARLDLPPSDASPRVAGEEDLARPAACQVSVYPLGESDYMDTIYQVIETYKQRGLYGGSPHFCTRLDGSIAQVFAALEETFRQATQRARHTVMVATISCNSPSRR